MQHNYEVFLCFWCGNDINVEPKGKLFVMVTLILTTIQACPQSLTWKLLDYNDRLELLQKNQKNNSSLSCNTIMKCFCVFCVVMASLWTPGKISLYCQTQKLVFASVNTFHSANQIFDSTLNVLHLMALLAEK